jgi:hypothetical protein
MDTGRRSGSSPTAIESAIDGDPVAARVRDIVTYQQTWTGTAADFFDTA